MKRRGRKLNSEPQFFAQGEQFIPELGGGDEVEVFCCLFHFLFCFGDIFFQLFAGQVVDYGVGGDVGFFGFDISIGFSPDIEYGFLVEDFFAGFEYGGWGDSVGLVIVHLNRPSAQGFVNGFAHRIGDGICIEDDEAVGITGGASCGLGEGSVVSEEAFFIGIEDGYQGYFRQVEAFAEEVYADEYIKSAEPEVADNFDAFHGFDFGVDIAHFNADFGEVFGQFFCHAFCKGSNEYPFLSFDSFVDLFEQVINLVKAGTDFDGGIEQAGRSDELFYDKAAGFFELIVSRGSTDEYDLIDQAFEFREIKGAVVNCGG